MSIKRYIPNLLTLGNLFCGTVATITAIQGDFELTAFLVVLGIFFDFFDGLAARVFKVQGELGKQLDSLADMVTSGVVPGIVMYKLIFLALIPKEMVENTWDTANDVNYIQEITLGPELIGLLLTLAACYRLANFNIDERQSDSFIGVPTPAMSLFVIALPLIGIYTEHQFFIDLIRNSYFLIGVTVLFSYLMNAEIPLFALKFKTFGFAENALKYVFIAISIITLLLLKFIAIPVIILLYVLLSVFRNLTKTS